MKAKEQEDKRRRIEQEKASQRRTEQEVQEEQRLKLQKQNTLNKCLLTISGRKIDSIKIEELQKKNIINKIGEDFSL